MSANFNSEYRWTAADLRQQYGLEGSVSLRQLETMAEDLGFDVDYREFSGRVVEMIFEDAIGIERRLSAADQRWLLAHALGHAIFHRTNQLIVSGYHQWRRDREERQANIFAGWLLFSFPFEAGRGLDPAEVAARADVPVGFLEYWREIVG